MKLKPGDLVVTPSGKTAAIVAQVSHRRIKVAILCAVPNPGPRYPAQAAPVGAIYRRKDLHHA